MQALEVVSLGTSVSGEALLRHLLRAGHRQAGLLLVLPDEGDQQALRELRQAGVEGAEPGLDCAVVDPTRFPVAARALHRLGCLLTEATALSWGQPPHSLHPHLDDVGDWLCPSLSSVDRVHSRILLSTAERLDEHVDRGLFNVVLGTAHDLGPILLRINGTPTPMQPLLPGNAPKGAILGLLIPGYTLQALDARTPALPHSVDVAALGRRRKRHAEPRCTVVLQWHLSASYSIGGVSLGQLLSQFESVRTVHRQGGREGGQRAGGAPAARQQEEAQAQPAEDAAAPFTVFVKTLAGKTHSFGASPDWTVEELKQAIADEVGVPAPSQRLIFAGRRLEDGHTLGDCGLQHESTVLLVLALRGMPGGGDPGPGPFQIFVIDLERKSHTFSVGPDTTVGELKQGIAGRWRLDPLAQRLIFAGMQLEDTWTMKHSGVWRENTLHLVLRLTGD